MSWPPPGSAPGAEAVPGAGFPVCGFSWEEASPFGSFPRVSPSLADSFAFPFAPWYVLSVVSSTARFPAPSSAPLTASSNQPASVVP
jgi:hypothetical protein